MVASFLILMILAAGFVVLWVVWWLVAELFSGSSRPIPARTSVAARTSHYSQTRHQKEPRSAA